jgi:hypothetical protein
MVDIVEYLYEKAREIREFAAIAPEIKDDLFSPDSPDGFAVS